MASLAVEGVKDLVVLPKQSLVEPNGIFTVHLSNSTGTFVAARGNSWTLPWKKVQSLFHVIDVEGRPLIIFECGKDTVSARGTRSRKQDLYSRVIVRFTINSQVVASDPAVDESNSPTLGALRQCLQRAESTDTQFVDALLAFLRTLPILAALPLVSDRSSSFRSTCGLPLVACSHADVEGGLLFLEDGLLFVKPFLHILYSSISEVCAVRSGSAYHNWRVVSTQVDDPLEFNQVQALEKSRIDDYLQERNPRIRFVDPPADEPPQPRPRTGGRTAQSRPSILVPTWLPVIARNFSIDLGWQYFNITFGFLFPRANIDQRVFYHSHHKLIDLRTLLVRLAVEPNAIGGLFQEFNRHMRLHATQCSLHPRILDCESHAGASASSSSSSFAPAKPSTADLSVRQWNVCKGQFVDSADATWTERPGCIAVLPYDSLVFMLAFITSYPPTARLGGSDSELSMEKILFGDVNRTCLPLFSQLAMGFASQWDLRGKCLKNMSLLNVDKIALPPSTRSLPPLVCLDLPALERLPSLHTFLTSRILHQEYALEKICNALHNRLSDEPDAATGLLYPYQSPLVIVQPGPSGVGKTETCNAVVDALWGPDITPAQRNAVFKRIPLGSFTDPLSLGKLIGADAGTATSDTQRGELIEWFEGVQDSAVDPACPISGVLFFDECDKQGNQGDRGNPNKLRHSVLVSLIELFGSGEVTGANNNKTYHLTKLVIFLAGNVAEQLLSEEAARKDPDQCLEQVQPLVNAAFFAGRPEMSSRVQEWALYTGFSREQMEPLCAKIIQEGLQVNMSRKRAPPRFRIRGDESLLQHCLGDWERQRNLGARPIKSKISGLGSYLPRFLSQLKPHHQGEIIVSWRTMDKDTGYYFALGSVPSAGAASMENAASLEAPPFSFFPVAGKRKVGLDAGSEGAVTKSSKISPTYSAPCLPPQPASAMDSLSSAVDTLSLVTREELFAAARSGDIATIQRGHRCGHPMNISCGDFTLLELAAIHYKVDIVCYLLEHQLVDVKSYGLRALKRVLSNQMLSAQGQLLQMLCTLPVTEQRLQIATSLLQAGVVFENSLAFPDPLSLALLWGDSKQAKAYVLIDMLLQHGHPLHPYHAHLFQRYFPTLLEAYSDLHEHVYSEFRENISRMSPIESDIIPYFYSECVEVFKRNYRAVSYLRFMSILLDSFGEAIQDRSMSLSSAMDHAVALVVGALTSSNASSVVSSKVVVPAYAHMSDDEPDEEDSQDMPTHAQRWQPGSHAVSAQPANLASMDDHPPSVAHLAASSSSWTHGDVPSSTLLPDASELIDLCDDEEDSPTCSSLSAASATSSSAPFLGGPSAASSLPPFPSAAASSSLSSLVSPLLSNLCPCGSPSATPPCHAALALPWMDSASRRAYLPMDAKVLRQFCHHLSETRFAEWFSSLSVRPPSTAQRMELNASSPRALQEHNALRWKIDCNTPLRAVPDLKSTLKK